MSERDETPARLVPARPAGAQDAAAFKPRFPWRLLAVAALILGAFAAFYLIREQRRIASLREQLLGTQRGALAESTARYAATRRTLEDFILQAASETPTTWVDPRLRFSGLHNGKGLYLRLPAEEAGSRARIARAAATAPADSIPSCLGLAPRAARDLFEKGEFLSADWRDKVRAQDSVMKLRVTQQTLKQQISDDLPGIAEALRADWFLLVLDRPELPPGKVDAFLWDLGERRPLLRARIAGEGVLLQARVAVKDAPAAPKVSSPPAGAHDVAQECSIASQLRALAER